MIEGLMVALLLGGIGGGEDDVVDFEASVLPLLRDRCWECHQQSRRDEDGRLRRPKGRLRLDHRAGLRLGGGEGPAVIAGAARRSPLYQRVVLPEAHEDRMPPEDPPLTLAERERLRRWIDQGARFGAWDPDGEGLELPRADKVPERIRWAREVEEGAPPLDEAILERLRALGVRAERLAPDSRLLELSFPARERGVDAELFAALRPVLENVAELDLGRCEQAPRLLEPVASMPRLLRLDLSRTGVDGDGLGALRGHAQLRVLNLHGTKVDDASLPLLASLPELRRLYVWDTAVSAAACERFARTRPEVRVQRELVLPEPDPEPPRRRRRN